MGAIAPISLMGRLGNSRGDGGVGDGRGGFTEHVSGAGPVRRFLATAHEILSMVLFQGFGN